MKLAARTLSLVSVLALILPGCALFMPQPTETGLGKTSIAVKSPMNGAALMNINYDNVEYGVAEVEIDITASTDGLTLETLPLKNGETYTLKMKYFASNHEVEVYDAAENFLTDLSVKSKAWSAVARTLTVGLTEQGYSEMTEKKILVEVYYDKAKKVFTIVDGS